MAATLSSKEKMLRRIAGEIEALVQGLEADEFEPPEVQEKINLSCSMLIYQHLNILKALTLLEDAGKLKRSLKTRPARVVPAPVE